MYCNMIYMNTQMVSVTQVQRDFKNILTNLVPKNPTLIISGDGFISQWRNDSLMEAVE